LYPFIIELSTSCLHVNKAYSKAYLCSVYHSKSMICGQNKRLQAVSKVSYSSRALDRVSVFWTSQVVGGVERL
jgi:hypothetical protein